MAMPSPLSEISVHVECAYYRFVNVQVYFVLSWQRLSAEVADAGFLVTTAKCISIPVDVPQSRLLLPPAAAALHLIDSNVDQAVRLSLRLRSLNVLERSDRGVA